MMIRLRAALTVKSRASLLPGAMAWGKPPPQPGGENSFPLIATRDCDEWMLFSVFPRLLQLRFIAATLGWWYICEIQSETLISRPRLDQWRGFPGNLQNGHFLLTFSQSHNVRFTSLPSNFPTHTPGLSHLSSSPSSWSWNAQVPIWLGKLSEKKLSLPSPSTPQRASLFPHHSKHNFRNIFTGISQRGVSGNVM